MNNSTKVIIGLGLLGAGIYYATRKSDNTSPNDITAVTNLISGMSLEELNATLRNIIVTINEFKEHPDKYINAIGSERYYEAINRAKLMKTLLEQELVKRPQPSKIDYIV